MNKVSRVFAAVAVATTLSIAGAGIASAATIGSSGPLTEIHISDDLNCDVRYRGDRDPEFFGATACGTFAAAQGTLYGPEDIPAGDYAKPRTAWTPTMQVSGGAGSSSDPYRITTTVSGGALTITQVDTYVVGQNSYRSDVSVTNNSDATFDTVVYRAADCYLQNSDEGYGEYNSATGSVLCRAADSAGEHSSAGRIEEFVPLTAGSSFIYGFYADVWAAVGSQQSFPNELRDANRFMDNGMGLSWNLNLAAGQTKTVSVLTNFSPLGEVGLPTTLAVANSSIDVDQETTVTASVTNPNTLDQAVSSLIMTLPDGVSYVPGSSTDLGEPAVSAGGRTLTYAGPITLSLDEQIGFTFKVRGSAPGSGSIGIGGTTVGGAPILASYASLTVVGEQPEPVEIVLEAPVVTQASCSAAGAEVAPEVALPADTNAVTYSLIGEVVSGGTVTVEATPRAGGYLPQSADGWVIDAERNVASMAIELDEVECVAQIVAVAPVDPTITQATCKAVPTVTLAKTTGITYSGLPATLKGGDKFTLVATPSEGYELAAASGWTLNEDGTATKQFTLDKAPKCAAGGLAKTGVSPVLAGLGLTGFALAGAGLALLVARRNRNV